MDTAFFILLLLISSTNLFHSDQHRCVAHAYVKFMKDKFNDQVVLKIKATAFGHLFDLSKCIVPTTDFHALVSQYDGDSCFVLGETNVNLKLMISKKNSTFQMGMLKLKK